MKKSSCCSEQAIYTQIFFLEKTTIQQYVSEAFMHTLHFIIQTSS